MLKVKPRRVSPSSLRFLWLQLPTSLDVAARGNWWRSYVLGLLCFICHSASWIWRVQRTLKTIKALWSELCCPVSEISVVVTGHGGCNRVMTLNEQLTVWRRHPSNLRQLEQFSHKEWTKLPVDRCRGLIESNRNRLIAVIVSKGCATQY